MALASLAAAWIEGCDVQFLIPHERDRDFLYGHWFADHLADGTHPEQRGGDESG